MASSAHTFGPMRGTSQICPEVPIGTEVMTMHPKQQLERPTIAADEMLDIVRRRIIEIHIGLEDATNDDREAKAWAQQELMALIRELTPYRKQARGAPGNDA